MAARRFLRCVVCLPAVLFEAAADDAGNDWPDWMTRRRRTSFRTKLPTTEAPTTTVTTNSTTSTSSTSATTTTADPTTTTTTATTASTTENLGYCTETSTDNYYLNWEARGTTFFDGWDFLEWDANNGAVQYLNREQAAAERVTEAHDTHAILRVGSRGWYLKRKSAKIQTKTNWKYFLAAARFTHVPFGCGLWPAFWTRATGMPWPQGGELDILEYVNDLNSQTSLHVADSNRCKLDGGQVNRAGCPFMPDLNGMNYDCITSYPSHLGCAVNTLPLQSPAEWNMHPVTFVVEWTEDFIKVWKFPDYALPQDLTDNAPRPQSWDQWLVSYYPLRRSGDASCPNPQDVMAPQHFLLNIGLCGDWAGKVWGMSPTCTAMNSPAQGCRITDPLMEGPGENDCCTQFVWDADGQHGADRYFEEHGFFNISWVKIFQRGGGVR